MGLQDVFFQLGLPFDSVAAGELSTRIAEEVYLAALERSCELAAEHGPHPAWAQTRVATGMLHPDHFDVTPRSWRPRLPGGTTRAQAVTGCSSRTLTSSRLTTKVLQLSLTCD